MSHSKDAIRLTNRTALALRRSAKRIEKISLIGVIVLTLALGVYTVILGIGQLWMVPLMLVLIAALDTIIIAFSRSYYLMLLSQAICTEASAREMRRDMGEQKRRKKALSDLAGIYKDLGGEDVTRIAQAGLRQMHGQEDEVEPEDDDLAAPVHRIERTAPAVSAARTPQTTTIVPPASMRSGYRPPVRMQEAEEENEEAGEDSDSPRRRRRKPALQVIHGDQAN